MNDWLMSPASERLAWTLLHFLWQGTLLGLGAWAGFALLRRSHPQTRYLVGCAFLLACLGSAILTWVMLSPSAIPGFQVAKVSSDLVHPSFAEPSRAPIPIHWTTDLAWRARLQPFLPWIPMAWAGGVLVLSLRAAGGWIWLRRLKAAAIPLKPSTWLKRVVHRSGVQRTVRFLESVRVVSPMCMGLLRPVVLLPLGFFASLDPLAAEAVIAHELAHLRRMDGLINGLQCLIEVLLFFHPTVWWISRRIRTEREHCCDDAAVLACGDAILYAETLSRLDGLFGRPPSLALQASGGNLMERMRRMLFSDPPQLRFPAPGAALFLALMLIGTLPVQARRSRASQAPLRAPATNILPSDASQPIRDTQLMIQPPPPPPARQAPQHPWLGHSPIELPTPPEQAVPPAPLPPLIGDSTPPSRTVSQDKGSPPPSLRTVGEPSNLPASSRSDGPPKVRYVPDGWQPIDVPEGVSVLEEQNGLPFDPSQTWSTSWEVMTAGPPYKKGIRTFRFLLKPGETLKASMHPHVAKSTHMWLVQPLNSDPCLTQILAVNRDPRPQRKYQLEFTNTTNKPYSLLLVLSGGLRNHYRVNLERH